MPQLALAVDEALSNVIRHAYKNRCGCEVALDCQAYADCLEFTFADQGESADPGKFFGRPLDEAALDRNLERALTQVESGLDAYSSAHLSAKP